MRLLLLLLLALPAYSFAAITWGPQAGSGTYPTAKAACGSYSLVGSVSISDSVATCCQYDIRGNCYTSKTVYKTGSVCDAGTAWNSTNGGCTNTDPCYAKSGTSSSFTRSGTIGDSFFFMSGKLSGTANTGCQGGCDGIVSGVTCRVFAGEPGTYKCSGSLNYSGSQCQAGSPGDLSNADSPTPPPAPPTEDKDSNCGSWISTADGQSQTCVDTTTKVQPGTADAGSAPSPNPSSSVNDTTTVTTKKTNADGSVTTTTSKTTNNTYCTVGSCNTTSTTNTTVVVTDPAGNVTSNTTSCSGPNCGKPSDGTGNGSGSGGEGGDEITVIGGSGSQLVEPALGNFDDSAADWDEKVDEAQQELRDVVADIKSTFTASSSPTLSGGSGSLPCDSITVLGSRFSLCLTPYEGSLAIIKTILLFVAALIAFFIIFVRD
ncbi:hypothetical protein E5198_10310 [Pseudomonas sp. A-1]|uniref:hypothetical protein n=1 Tax=Pseudomonas sp. A-1 TaxID=1821274 RepID=UPI0010A6A382|nr:hypothetical protein [Pseudomonas sp. A-1]THG82150.1 hypothetical protein E5198_10310 [Pseudomonas sp. A-1]